MKRALKSGLALGYILTACLGPEPVEQRVESRVEDRRADPRSTPASNPRPPAPSPPSIRDPRGASVELSALSIETRRLFEPLTDAEQTFRGLPARSVLETVLGRRPAEGFVLARCRDGYLATIPAQRFFELDALFAFAIEGSDRFAVESSATKQVIDLAPYYLVWSSTAAVSASAFAYQVVALDHRAELPAVLADPPSEIATGAAAFRKHCSACHPLGGYGGQVGPELMAPIPISRWVDDQYLRRWILAPRTMRAGTTMPGLSSDVPDRARVADDIVRFLSALDRRP